MNEVKELVEELRNKKSRDNRELLDKSANMIEKLAKELCEKSGCHHKCHDTKDCVVEDEARAIIGDNLTSVLTNEEKVSKKEKQVEEMVHILNMGLRPAKETYGTDEIAKILYNAGYRKQSEGKWVAHPDEHEICATEFVCSNCKESFCSSEMTDCEFVETMKYCSNCGAKMKGGE